MNWVHCTAATWGGETINGIVRIGHNVLYHGRPSEGDYMTRFVKIGPPIIAVMLELRSVLAPLEMLNIHTWGDLEFLYSTDIGTIRKRTIYDMMFIGFQQVATMKARGGGITPVWQLDGIVDSELTELDDIIEDEVYWT